MKVVFKKVLNEPEVKEFEELKLEHMQEMVGGFIECVRVAHNIDMWINDCGKLEHLSPNIVLTRDDEILDVVCGDIFFAGNNSHGDTIGLADGQITWIKNKMAQQTVFSIRDMEFIPAWEYNPDAS